MDEKSAVARRERLVLRAFLVLPFAAPAAAWLAGADLRPGALGLSLLAAGYVLSAGGFEVGFHRLFAHRAFTAAPALRAALVIAGSTAALGPVFGWAAVHRRHHARSDADGDPHSPRAGLWHAHMGWLWDLELGMDEYRRVEDLIADPVVYGLGRMRAYLLWASLGLAVPAAVGALAAGAAGALTGLLWGGAVRLLLVQQLGFAVNSLGHLVGRRPYRTGDQSRDLAPLGLLVMGAGWQNTHHAFPDAASVQLRWWQADPGGWFIRLAAAAGLARGLRAPSEAQIREKSAP